MKPQPSDAPPSQRSVLAILGQRTGHAPKVLLPDSDSEHGASPFVDPGSSAAKLVPQGRGNYQLLGEIARGGMGVVLKGHDTDLGRDVAVKVLDPELAKRPEVVQRFVEEAQVGGQLQHPGIVPVYELGLMSDDRPYFTMKLIKGRTLAALLQQRKSPAENRGRMLAIFESVCQTMAYAHSKGVLHRDLKPANIMVGAFGEVQVVDWGLAKVLRRGGVADERRAKESLHSVIATVRSGPGSSGSDSLVGSVMGTPAYMAPEQAQGEVEQLDERADVFSLGAILCEILTGRPPYEEREGEPIVAQAARAKLEPARARIEGCDADPALVRLCLDCLTPARAARPANADEVARAVHAYLTTVEDRARAAEVAATEARIKAAEERRRRKLTVALAGTIAVALLAAGGGTWWVGRERALRVEQTRSAVEAAHGEAIEHGRAGQPDQALAAARRALALAESGQGDAALLERARGFVQQAEAALRAAELERTLHEQDERLRERLIELRIAQIGTIGDRQREIELDAAFAAAFRSYGVDLDGDDVVPALKRIRERAIAEEVALALDDWGRVRRKVHGPRSEKTENLFVLSMDLDADPERQRMRQAIVDSDVEVLLELSAPENLPKLAPGSIFVLSAALWDGFPEHKPRVYRVYDQALRLYPGDYVLQSVGGTIYDLAGRKESALMCRAAALSLRPGDATALYKFGEILTYLGQLTEAEGALRAAVAADPRSQNAQWALAVCLAQLGEHVAALECYTRAFELGDDPDLRADIVGARFYLGLATQDQLKDLARSATTALGLVNTLYPLLAHPDPRQRDVDFVLRQIEANRPRLREFEAWYVLESIARARAEDWAGALEVLEGHYYQSKLLLVTPNTFDFLRALLYARLGNTEAARECYARGVAEWDVLTAGNPAAWDRSEAAAWRREAEAALGI
ncbi:MAG: protein kinase [Planctomycetes bacterium]|nr:protein kinase [Planctomycetota bacterium]